MRPVSGAGVVHYHLLNRPRSVPMALGPAPHTPIAGRGVHPRQGGRGIPGGKDRRGERKGDGRMRSDRDERGERKRIKNLGPVSGHTCRSVLNQLSGSLVVPCDLWWTARCSSGRGQPAASPPFPAPPQTWWMAAGFGLQANGADSSAPSRSAASSTQEHGSESSVPPVLPLLQHHRFGQPLAVSATSCCPISSAPQSPSAARALWQRVPPSSWVSAPM